MHTFQQVLLKAIALAVFCLTLLLPLPTAYAQAGLVSHWPAEGNANDVVGGNNGTLQGGAAFAPGIVGQAFSLDGVNRYIEVPDSPSLSITGPLTLAAWINTNTIAVQQAIVEKYDVPGHNGYFLRLDGGKLVSSVCSYPLTCSTYAIGATTLTTGTWHHVAAVYDGTSIKVYLDGTLDGSVATNFIPTDGATSLKIGARGDDANTRFNGLIDEVKIYNRALSASEVFLSAHCPTATTQTIGFQRNDDGTFITIPNADTHFETLTLSGATFRQVRSYYNAFIYTGPTGVITVDLPPNTFSFGTDLAAFYSTPGTYTITLSTGQTYQIASTGARWTSSIWDFFGVISSTPIEWVTFSYNNDYLVIDNFITGTGCGTPEVCDGVDNDLDGSVDEDFTNTDGDSQADCVDPDDDNDTVLDANDNCPLIANTDQADNDHDGIGDACDTDDDNDGVPDATDNCSLISNAGQIDNDQDGIGDSCDEDDDNDGVSDSVDNCPLTANPAQTDTDGDTIGDTCDSDDDGDGVPDTTDNCPLISNAGQADNDNDGIGDSCDEDDDNDGVPDATDNCPLTANSVQTDTDGDGIGDSCDSDDDNDGVPDTTDNCPTTANPDQADYDLDDVGDVCDPVTGPPTNKDQCKNDGWQRFDFPRLFKNQGDCIQYVNTGK